MTSAVKSVDDGPGVPTGGSINQALFYIGFPLAVFAICLAGKFGIIPIGGGLRARAGGHAHHQRCAG